MIWYPYCQMKTAFEPYKVIKAKDCILSVEANIDGKIEQKDLIDSVSSWWSAIHGYNNAEMNEAIKSQVDNFSHVMLGSLTHENAQKLSSKLANMLPADLDYCFFSDSGSVAVEVAIKMALQYFINRNIKGKTTILSLANSYHGDTFMAMSVGDDSDYHGILSNLRPMIDVFHINPNEAELEKVLTKNADKIAAFIVEPLLQGAGGMKMYELDFLRFAQKACAKNDVLLIFDEIATGFGRTGNRFVSDLVTPDIVCLGKALTGGYIGHAATIARRKVFNAFYDDDSNKALMHGPTFMGNALACIASLKSIEIFERDNYLSKVKSIESIAKSSFAGFSHKNIKEIRILGACICIECISEEITHGFSRFAYENGIFSRPFLNIIYSMPPYIIKESELIKIFDTMKAWFLR